MYIFEENEYVLYKGDYTSLDETRRSASLAIVDRIDQDKFPYVGLKLLPSEELLGVEARLVRTLETNNDYLIKLGFIKEEINKVNYYILGDIVIAGMVIYPKPRHVYFAGFRYIPFTPPIQFDSTPFIEKDEVSEEKLEQVFPNMHNLNRLVNFLDEKGLSTKSIPEIIDIHSTYY